MTTSGTIKVMFSLIKNIKGEKPMSGFTTNLDLAYKVNPNTKAQSPYKMNRAKKNKNTTHLYLPALTTALQRDEVWPLQTCSQSSHYPPSLPCLE